MNIHRKVLSIVAGALLMASLPAGAQVLGGNAGGAVSGAFGGGRLGSAGAYGAAAGNVGADATGTIGAARDRASQAGNRSREIGAGAYGTASSRVETTRGTAAAGVETAHSAGVRGVRESRRAASSAAQTSSAVAEGSAAQANTASNDGVLVNSAGGAGVEQSAMGRNVAAHGVAGSQTSADRSAVTNSTYGEADASVKKE